MSLVAPGALGGAAILGAAAGGAWLLQRAWWRKTDRRRAFIVAGWSLLVVLTLVTAWLLGSARGTFTAFTLVSVAALAVVASGLQRRAARAGRTRNNESLAPEPLERPSTWWRTTLRWLLAGPIGMIAAMAVGICYAVWVPGEPQTRLLIGGLLVPVLWGGAMAWTLADNRILRATAVLVGTAFLGFAASILKGFA
ncbi:hypothetical protein RCO27_00155 [Sphingosinicella sp. LHD-64]|uniref:hypothetical protein n=1 Tax=Sphingosinicella sp. LHD-64 TaxID=3072139 RepID=UPI00280F5D94|nr:hypothetical protein [Sphingosinicella sp. LHD-64]MDQ8754631.1 hypothetical protein [Sphingosinicella sp. LHD-64]